MAWFTVRRTRVLRVYASTTREIEAETAEAAIAMVETDGGDDDWADDERKVQSERFEATEFTPAEDGP